MKILVCVKQIVTSEIKPDDSGYWIKQEKSSSSNVMNRFDENAVEEAILLKEQLKSQLSGNDSSEICVDVISVGPPGAAESIKRSMGMGADNGIHIITEDLSYVSAAVTASRIAAMIKKEGINKKDNAVPDSQQQKYSASLLEYDLILTGIMSEDLMQAQVGPMVAEHLKIPCISSVVAIELKDNMKEIEVQRELEGGMRQNIKIRLPVLLTIQAGINQPRYPSLSNILKANKKQIWSLHVSELFPDNMNGAPEHEKSFVHKKEFMPESAPVIQSENDPLNLVRLEYPEKKRASIFLEGSTVEKATELMTILKKRGLI